MSQLRLDKLLSDLGIASRKELRQIIKSGRVCVDGLAVTAPETKVDGEKSLITLDGERLNYTRFHYYIMDKPAGVLTATEDHKQKTVLDLLTTEERRMGLFPVGRLDKDTTGLLLLTDDGDYAHRVISPRSCVEKRYYAVVSGGITEEDIRAFHEGILLADGTRCLPAELEPAGERSCYVTVMEGKYHQVKRMIASRGKSVEELRRISIGALRLPEDSFAGFYCQLAQREAMSVFAKEDCEGST